MTQANAHSTPYTVDDLTEALFQQLSPDYQRSGTARFRCRRTAQRLMRHLGERPQLSNKAIRTLVWLGHWDADTIEGVEELLEAAQLNAWRQR